MTILQRWLHIAFALVCTLNVISAQSTNEPPLNITIERYTINLHGKPFYVKGVAYNPAMLGTAPAWTPPWGDYLQPQHADIWQRDFPVIKSMGANTLRVWQWNNEVDHGAFLDAARRAGLYVIVTFYTGNSYQFPVQQDWQRANMLGTFKWQVQRYVNHPALLGWSFGGELNAPWNNYLQAFSNAFGCGWSPACLNDPARDNNCEGPVTCVYSNVFGFMQAAARFAKDAMGGKPSHLIIGGLADVDRVTDRIAAFEHIAPDVDAWGLQIYRGKDFGEDENDFIANYAESSVKPLIVTEFGVDAYSDPCGDQTTSPCYNFAHNPPSGYGEDEPTQAEWLISQAQILYDNSSVTDPEYGVVAGAIVYEWLDEYWRSTTGVTGCYGPIPYGQPGFDKSLCDWKAHVDCPESDLWYHSLCGYPSSSFDHYTNVAWFGLVKVSTNPGADMDLIVPRQAYDRLKELWGEPKGYMWLYLIVIALGVAAALSWYLYERWLRRLTQLERVGISRKSLFSLNDYRTVDEHVYDPHADERAHLAAQQQPQTERTPLIHTGTR